MSPLRAIIAQETDRLLYLATWEYAVTGTNGDGSINATATDGRCPQPSLNNLPVRAGPEGGTSTPTAGKTCLVRFINGDPTRPVVVGNEPLVKTSTIDATDTVAIGPSVTNAVVLAGGTAPTARMGDSVQVYFPTAPMPCAGIVGAIPGTFVGTITFAAPAVGSIMTGQSKVTA
jgi:hypothetical protein